MNEKLEHVTPMHKLFYSKTWPSFCSLYNLLLPMMVNAGILLIQIFRCDSGWPQEQLSLRCWELDRLPHSFCSRNQNYLMLLSVLVSCHKYLPKRSTVFIFKLIPLHWPRFVTWSRVFVTPASFFFVCLL